MKCPFCDSVEDKVLESREVDDGSTIRRRRECSQCRGRFTSYEKIEERPLMVIKRDGRREQFVRSKIVKGILHACEKRPVSIVQIENIAMDIERELQKRYDREVAATVIGEQIMERLYDLDEVAYVRFASVYRQFKDVNQFLTEVKGIIGKT